MHNRALNIYCRGINWDILIYVQIYVRVRTYMNKQIISIEKDDRIPFQVIIINVKKFEIF